MSKLLENVAGQLVSYLLDNDLLPDRQSAYRAFRSTETVIARLLSNILTALDAGDIAALALLDLSAAFDTVDGGPLHSPMPSALCRDRLVCAEVCYRGLVNTSTAVVTMSRSTANIRTFLKQSSVSPRGQC